MGRINLNVVFPGLRCDMWCVVASIGTDGLLGTEALQSCLPHQLDLRTGQLWANGRSTLQLHQQKSTPLVSGSLITAVVIPPDSEVVAKFSISGGQLGACALIDPNWDLTEQYGVLVGHTLVDATTPSASVLIINRNAEEVVLPCGSSIGDLVPVLSVSVARSMEYLSETTEKLPEYLEDIVRGAHTSLGDTGRQSLRDLLHKYEHVFPAPGEPVTGRSKSVQHEIEINDARPVRCGPRRLAPAGLRREQDCVREMLSGGQIEPSDSPWASPVVLVTKKDGSTRFCVDYRRLNSLTVKDAYPLPRIDDSLRLLGNQQWFSTMDLASGYWQVAMSPEAKRKAAFVTNEGLFQFRVMPFGLCNAPATFERLMDRVLCGMRWSRCLVYLDDVISFGRTVPEAIGRLEEVLARLSDFGLQLKAKKCTFMQTEVGFLGHIVGRAGLACADLLPELSGETWVASALLDELTVDLPAAGADDELVSETAEDKILQTVRSWVDSGAAPQWIECAGLAPELRSWRLQVGNIRIDSEGRLWRRRSPPAVGSQLVIPVKKCQDFIRKFHDSLFAGHLGITRTVYRLLDRVYWPGLRGDVQTYIKSCTVCIARKSPCPRKVPMGHVDVGHRWERVAMDLLDMSVTTARGNRYVLVMVDCFTRWTEAFPLPDKTAQSVADAFFNQIVCRFGMPSVIHSDQGREFENKIMQELCLLGGSHKTRTTPYHPESDGMVERFNRTLLMMLAMFAGKNRDDWDDLLPAVMMAYRSSVHESRGFSPYRLMFGEECTLPMDIGLPTEQLETTEEITSPYAIWVRDALEEAYEQVRLHSGQAVQRQKRLYDRRAVKRNFTVGDWVMRYYAPAKKCKLDSAWIGPYLVVSFMGWTIGIQKDPGSPIVMVHCQDAKKIPAPRGAVSWLKSKESSIRPSVIVLGASTMHRTVPSSLSITAVPSASGGMGTTGAQSAPPARLSGNSSVSVTSSVDVSSATLISVHSRVEVRQGN